MAELRFICGSDQLLLLYYCKHWTEKGTENEAGNTVWFLFFFI